MRTEGIQDEAVLAAAARRGDKKALCELFERNWGWLKGLVYGIVCDTAATDDILQDICVRVIEKISSLRDAGRFRAWLAVIARREALRYRVKQREHLRLRPEQADTLSDENADKLFEQIEYADECRKILDEVLALPDKYRQIFMLDYSGDLTYRQMSEILNVPLTTVQIRLVRARRMLLERVKSKDKGSIQGT